MTTGSRSTAITCPTPRTEPSLVLLAHGGGGRLTNDLIERLFLPAFGTERPEARHDGAIVEVGDARVAFTTDSYVVQPLFFPGGDIGTLAVHGTVNDLAMCGARPLAISLGLIIEEGLPTETLQRVVDSLGRAARDAGVPIVTGDTKVVDEGKGDGLFVNTSGVGAVQAKSPIGPTRVRPGDAVILSGDLGRHGTAIMAEREGLRFESAIESDTVSLWPAVETLLDADVDVHCLRDLTRGGLATALVEIAGARDDADIAIDEAAVPVGDAVRGACELLGLDPLYVANEGRLVCFVPEADAERAVEILRRRPEAEGAVRIGTVTPGGRGRVTLRTRIGTRRVVDMLSGEQLPRIC